MLIKMGGSRPRSRQHSNIIVKNYEHFNNAFKNWDCAKGRYISSKSDYEKVLHEEGMITEKEADRLGLNSGPKHADYVLTKDTQALIEAAKCSKDSKGNIHPSTSAIEALNKKKALAKFNSQHCPECYKPEGGFE